MGPLRLESHSKKAKGEGAAILFEDEAGFRQDPTLYQTWARLRVSAGNPHHGAEKYPENLRDHRALLRPVSLSFSKDLQCRHHHRLSGKSFTRLFPSQGLSHARPCVLSQRQRCLGVVQRTPTMPGGLQSTRLFSSTQLIGENPASYASAWHTQPVSYNPIRTACSFNFNLSQ